MRAMHTPSRRGKRTSRSAASSMIPPRAQLTMRTPFLHLARFSELSRYSVSFVKGVWIVMKSERLNSSSVLTGSMP